MTQDLTYGVSAPGSRQASADVAAFAQAVGSLPAAAKNANAEFAGLRSNLREAQEALGKAASEADGLADSAKKTKTAIERLNDDVRSGALVADELAAAQRRALETSVEFGAGQREVAAAQERITTTAQALGVSEAVVAKAFEKMVDESEDAVGSLRNLNLSLELAQTKMLKVEDAGKLVGRVLRGDVAALKELSPAARAAAEAIEKIPDATERAHRGMRVLRAEANGSVQALDSIRGQFGKMDAGLANLGLAGVSSAAAIGTVATAAGAATLALGKLTVEGMLKFESSTDEGAKRLEIFNRELERLEMRAAGSAHAMVDFDDVVNTNTARIAGLTKALDDLEKEYKDNEYQVDNVTQGFGYLGATLLWLASPLKWVAAGAGALKYGFDELVGTEDELETIQKRVTREIWEANRAVYAIEGPMKTWDQRIKEVTRSWQDLKDTIADGVRTDGYYDKDGNPLSSDIPAEFAPKPKKTSRGAGSSRKAELEAMKRAEEEARDKAVRVADSISYEGFIDGERQQAVQVIQRIKARQAELELVKELQRLQGDPYSDPIDKRAMAKAEAEAKALAEAARAQRLAMRDDNADFSPEVNAAIKQMERQTRLLNAQKQFYKEMGDAGVQAFADIAMSAGHAFGLMISGANGAGQSFTEGVLGAIGLVVPVFQALGTTMLAANNFWGLGVILSAGVLAGLLAGAKQRLAPRTTSLGSTGASPGGRDGLLQRYRQDQEERRQQITINMHYGNDLVEKRQIEVNRRTQRLHEVRTRRVRG